MRTYLQRALIPGILIAFTASALAVTPPSDESAGNLPAAPSTQSQSAMQQAPRPSAQHVRYAVDPAPAPTPAPRPPDTRNSRHHHRSFAKSVVIVAGSAVAGAAIGGLAAGGKGVAVGLLAGGAGGFLYDRATDH